MPQEPKTKEEIQSIIDQINIEGRINMCIDNMFDERAQ